MCTIVFVCASAWRSQLCSLLSIPGAADGLGRLRCVDFSFYCVRPSAASVFKAFIYGFHDVELMEYDKFTRHITHECVHAGARDFLVWKQTLARVQAPQFAAVFCAAGPPRDDLRPRSRGGTPLVTVCNHVSTLDDPLFMSALLPNSVTWVPKVRRLVGRGSWRGAHLSRGE